MKNLEDFLKPTQAELFKLLCKKFHGKAVGSEGSFILVKGNAPVMLLAHLDTVHAEPVKEICATPDGNILMSPQGIGGDDRCGVYALNKIYNQAEIKPYLLFTCDEEIGGVGARQFRLAHSAGLLPAELKSLKLLIEIDRKGKKDAVYYDCDNPAFEKYISSKGFKTAHGSFSDISVVAPELGVAAVNLSSGYYNAHTLHEYINRKHLERTISKVAEIISDAAQKNFQQFKYIPRQHIGYTFEIADDVPKNLPKDYEEIYMALLDNYSQNELEEYRNLYGNEILRDLCRQEFGVQFDNL